MSELYWWITHCQANCKDQRSQRYCSFVLNLFISIYALLNLYLLSKSIALVHFLLSHDRLTRGIFSAVNFALVSALLLFTLLLATNI